MVSKSPLAMAAPTVVEASRLPLTTPRPVMLASPSMISKLVARLLIPKLVRSPRALAAPPTPSAVRVPVAEPRALMVASASESRAVWNRPLAFKVRSAREAPKPTADASAVPTNLAVALNRASAPVS